MDDDWGYPHDFGNLHILSISSVNLCDIQWSSPQMLLFLSFSQSFIQFIIRSYLGCSIINQPASLGYPTSRKAPYSGHSHSSPDPGLWISRSHRTLPSYQHTTSWRTLALPREKSTAGIKRNSATGMITNSIIPTLPLAGWEVGHPMHHRNWTIPGVLSSMGKRDATGMILQCPVLQWKRESTDPCWAMEIINL